jgi:hypothetical protein
VFPFGRGRNKKRRSGKDRRKGKDPTYAESEKRSGTDQRSGTERRKNIGQKTGAYHRLPQNRKDALKRIIKLLEKKVNKGFVLRP